MTKEKLIAYYERKYKTVKDMWKPNGRISTERSKETIAYAKKEMFVARIGGEDGLVDFWKSFA